MGKFNKNINGSESLETKRRLQILNAAVKILKKKKFNAASMREIAQAAGMSMGNLYNYIEKKEDIMTLLYQEMYRQFSVILNNVVIQYEYPVDQLVHFIKDIYGITCRMKEETLILMTETKSLEKKILKEILQLEAKIIYDVEEIIKRGIKMKCFDCEKPNLVANLIVYNAFLIPLRGWIMVPKHSEEEILEVIIGCFLRELGTTKINCTNNA
jgi:AcrR family transcriptional regulator